VSEGCRICDEVGGPLVVCTICRHQKKPVGRDARDDGYCTSDCPGYRRKPLPSELWPGERYGDSLGHMDWHEEVGT
jgi:hypothetical protein